MSGQQQNCEASDWASSVVRTDVGERRPTIVFVVRHGETEWNRGSRQQGHLDSPLTESGMKQAHALADGLAEAGLDALYSSDLGRALSTAQVIGMKLGLAVNTDVRLRERHLGCMQGLTRAEFRRDFPAECAAFDSGDPEYAPPGGESVRQRFERSVACCFDLAARHPGGKILIVTHGGVLTSLFYHTLRIPLTEPRRFSLFNAAINCFTVRGDAWRLDRWGDTSHLGAMAALDDR